jgi:hypothetical protein
VRPAADASMSWARRRSRVSSLFAVITHRIAAWRYEGGRASKFAHARFLARKRLSKSELKVAECRCS